ncbi:hypothetical protein L7F22_056624 [Adiantum nelumboides]|nr:hypothetical protein [Adiantum nelumboides]
MADLEVVAGGSLLKGASDAVDAVDGAAAVGEEGVEGGSGVGAGGAAGLPADVEGGDAGNAHGGAAARGELLAARSALVSEACQIIDVGVGLRDGRRVGACEAVGSLCVDACSYHESSSGHHDHPHQRRHGAPHLSGLLINAYIDELRLWSWACQMSCGAEANIELQCIRGALYKAGLGTDFLIRL